MQVPRVTNRDKPEITLDQYYEGCGYRFVYTPLNHLRLLDCVYDSGASGVLGSAIYKVFKADGHDTIGLARHRSGDDLKKLDLTSGEDVDAFLTEAKPDCKFCPA